MWVTGNHMHMKLCYYLQTERRKKLHLDQIVKWTNERGCLTIMIVLAEWHYWKINRCGYISNLCQVTYFSRFHGDAAGGFVKDVIPPVACKLLPRVMTHLLKVRFTLLGLKTDNYLITMSSIHSIYHTGDFNRSCLWGSYTIGLGLPHTCLPLPDTLAYIHLPTLTYN